MSNAGHQVQTSEHPDFLPSLIRAMEDPRTRFARHAYDTQEALIRQLDLKAGAMIGMLAILLTATLSMAVDISHLLHFWGKGAVTSWTFVICGGASAIGFFWTAYWVQGTIRPRSGNPKLGHIYHEDIVLHGSPDAFHAFLQQSSDADLLKSLTSSVYALSLIVKDKIAALNKAHIPTLLTIAFWIPTTFLLVYISSWR